MKKWRHIQVMGGGRSNNQGDEIAVSPADRIPTDWLLTQFPNLKISGGSSRYLMWIETKSYIGSEILNALWTYLEDNGWEYCSDNVFRKLVEE